MYQLIGLPNAEGFYEAFATSPDHKGQFCSTPEQQAYNKSTTTCRTCKGAGYRTERRGKLVVRDSGGCFTCLGLGKVPNDL